MREAGLAVIGGFHSPLEKDCLDILLKGRQPVVICPGRGLEKMRLPRNWQGPLDDGRLLLISPFEPGTHRVTEKLALARNRFVAALAEAVIVAHASAGSKIEQLGGEVVAWGKKVFAIKDEKNHNLISLGARPLSPTDITPLLG
ncbi:MAG: hypothetical protein AB1641_12695 [Thermodesulfobacteriota bacterium]